MKNIIWIALVAAFFSCKQTEIKINNTANMERYLPQQTIDETIKELETKFSQTDTVLIQRGVKLTSDFWIADDGSPDEFKAFCLNNYTQDKKALLDRFSKNLETVSGHFSQISTQVQFPLHVGNEPLLPVDEIFASWSPFAHIADDWFDNKLAMILHLNFPYYPLHERTRKGLNGWTDEENAAANLGLQFASRTPSKLQQEAGEISTRAELYVSNYNIYMHNIVDEKGKRYFPEDMRLISHWGLRDELKSNYADTTETGLAKQKLIYDLMLRIINQEIPQEIINTKGNDYCPTSNKLFKDGKETAFEREKDVRYAFLLDIFQSAKATDKYSPIYPDAIKRAFDQGLEMTFAEVEKIFITFLSDTVKYRVGEIIRHRLGRPLQPHDIWYDGFKTRSSINEEELSAKTAKQFPNAQALEKQLPDILQILGYTKERAGEICQYVAVDAARGSGHAMGAAMRGDISRLRVRVPETGLNYNGFNVAMHEFGHNVEQTVSLYDIKDYLNSGIPNTAFTEALAFLFQKRDLFVLGYKEEEPHKSESAILANYWEAFEIMGVALVDMYAWKWMYANPEAKPEELKAAIISIAENVWKDYYSLVFYDTNSSILAIYSHMISYPLYLAAYPIGHLIEFQLEQHLAGKNFATEIDRIFSIGHWTPPVWMTKAVGTNLSAAPFLEETLKAVRAVRAWEFGTDIDIEDLANVKIR
ncbi:MAG: hypothetical protein LBT50_04935 [Prevotellaceae bacterium]|nr:hypothetical protein [Prevotellaceae bacterium]